MACASEMILHAVSCVVSDFQAPPHTALAVLHARNRRWFSTNECIDLIGVDGGPQVLNQATSLDGLKKSEGYPGSLVEHFYAVFGPKGSDGFKEAQRRFACSLAG